MADRHYIYCDCCPRRHVVAEVRDGQLIIQARHHGEMHATLLALDSIGRGPYTEDEHPDHGVEVIRLSPTIE